MAAAAVLTIHRQLGNVQGSSSSPNCPHARPHQAHVVAHVHGGVVVGQQLVGTVRVLRQRQVLVLGMGGRVK